MYLEADEKIIKYFCIAVSTFMLVMVTSQAARALFAIFIIKFILTNGRAIMSAVLMSLLINGPMSNLITNYQQHQS